MTENCSIQSNCWLDRNSIPDQVTIVDDEVGNGGSWWQFIPGSYQNYNEYSFAIVENNSGYSAYSPASGLVTFDFNQFKHLNTGEAANFNFKFAVYDKFGSFIKTVQANVVINGITDHGDDIGSGPLHANDMHVSVFEAEGLWKKLPVDGAATEFVIFDNNFNAGILPIHNNVRGMLVVPTDQFGHLNIGDKLYLQAKYYAKDAYGNVSNTANIFIEIKGSNNLPTAENDYANVTKGSSLLVDVLANDHDVDNNNSEFKVTKIKQVFIGDQIISDANEIAKYAIIENNKVKVLTDHVNVSNGASAQVKVCYEMTDGEYSPNGEGSHAGYNYATGGYDEAILTVTINSPTTPTNTPPMAKDINLTDNEDGTLPSNTGDTQNISFKLDATDVDGDALAYKIFGNGVVDKGNGNYQVTKDGKTYDAKLDSKGVLTFDKSQFQWMNNDTPNIVFDFKYAVTDNAGPAQTYNVSINDALSGGNGNQTWGSIKVTMKDYNGNAIQAIKYTDMGETGLGNNAGRIGEIDFNKDTGKSETVELDFPKEVTNAKVTLGLFWNEWSEQNIEIATWKAYDANGNLVGQGKINGDVLISSGNKGVGVIDINIPGGFTKVVLGATYYNERGDNNNFTAWNDSSDYIVTGVQYTTKGPQWVEANGKITITGVNDNPIARPDTYSFNENSGWKVINVLANDTDDVDDASSTLKVTSVSKIVVDGQTITGAAINDYIKISADGKTVEYNTNKIDVANGQTKAVVITYNITDPHGGTASSTATVNVKGTNGGPIVNDINLTDNEDGTLPANTGDLQKISFKLDAVDPEGDALAYKIFGNGVVDKGNGNYQVTKDGKTYDVKLSADGILTFDKAQFQWMNTDTPNIVFDFKYAVTDGSGSSKTVNVSINDALTGPAGNQTWGGIKVVMRDTEGNVVDAVKQNIMGEDGLGNNVGRKGEIDFDRHTGKSESVELSFNEQVTNAKVQLNVFWHDAVGATEVAVWKAYDDNGNLVGEGKLNASVLINSGPQGTGVIDINIPGGFTKIVISGTYYNDNPNNGNQGGDDTTDFLIGGVQYTTKGQQWIEANGKITITGLNDDPIARPDTYNFDENGGWKAINVLANDTDDVDDPSSSLKVTDVSKIVVDGQTITGAAINDYIKISADGKTVEYNTNKVDVANGQTKTIVVTYNIIDPHGGKASSTATINIKGTNDAPEAKAVVQTDNEDGTLPANSGDTSKISFKFDATDPNGDAITYKITGTGVVDNGNGNYKVTIGGKTYDAKIVGDTITFDTAQFQWMNTDTAPVVFNFNYTATDAHGAASSSTAKFTITGLNDAPIARPDTYSFDENGGWKVINVLANDTDDVDDASSSLKVTGVSKIVVDGQTITDQTIINQYIKISADGKTVEYNTDKLDIPAGQTKSVVITYNITDPHGGTASSTATVNLTGGNDAPEAKAVVQTDNEDGTAPANTGDTSKISFKFDATDPNGDAITYKITGTGVVDNGNGNYKVTIGGKTYDAKIVGDTITFDTAQFQWMNTDTAPVVFNFNYTATDAHGASSSSTAKFTITGLNDAPIARPDSSTVTEDTGWQKVDVLKNDTDDVDDATSTLTVTGVSKLVIDGVEVPAGEISQYIRLTGDKKFVEYNTDKLEIEVGQTKSIVITYSITDPHGGTASSTHNITVNGVQDNRPPVANDDNIGEVDVNTGTPIVIDPTKNDTDPDGDPVTVKSYDRIVIKDSNDNVIVDSTDPNIIKKYFDLTDPQKPVLKVDQFNVPIDGKNTITLTYEAQDPKGLTDEADIKIVLVNPNKPPVAEDDAKDVTEGTKVLIDVLDNDTTGGDNPDSISIVPGSLKNLVIDGVSIPDADLPKYIKIVNGQVEFDATTLNVEPGQKINVTFDYTIVDQYGKTDSAKVNVNIVDNGAPIDQDVTYTEDEDATGGTSNVPGEVGELTYKFDATSPVGNPLVFTAPETVTVNGQTIRLVNNGDGTFSLNKEDVTTKLNSMYEGQTATLTFNYVAKDSVTGISTNAVAKIIFNGLNDAPTANDDTASVKEGQSVSIDVLANDTDPDTQDSDNPLFITKVKSITIDGVTITDAAIIADYITYVNTGALGSKSIIFKAPDLGLNDGESKQVTIVYEARDKQGATDDAKVVVTVGGVTETTIDIALDADDAGFKVITNDAIANNNFESTTASVLNRTVTYKNDTFVANPGDDKVIGDIRNYTVEVKAGDAYALVKNSFSGNAIAESDASFNNNKITFGADTITGLAGNDNLIGDVETLKIDIRQGDAKAEIDYETCGGNPEAQASANATFSNNVFKFGNDVINGGLGNDKIVGDVVKFDVTYLSGTRTEIETNQGSVVDYKDYGITGNTFTFGNDVIDGGKGDDVLVGDVESFKYVDQIRTYTFDSNTGKLVETVTNHTFEFRADDADAFNAFKGSELWKNNTFNFGQDTFVFDASGAFGNDKILDFNINNEGDKLKFTNLIDANNSGTVDFNDLKAITKVENDGNGFLKLSIDTNNDGTFESSITFLNKTFVDGSTQITDYFQTSDFII
jgi:hypothetical protein